MATHFKSPTATQYKPIINWLWGRYTPGKDIWNLRRDLATGLLARNLSLSYYIRDMYKTIGVIAYSSTIYHIRDAYKIARVIA